MKKILIVVSLLILIGLGGCSNNLFCEINPGDDKCLVEYTPITNDTTGDIQNSQELTVESKTDNYSFTIPKIETFTYTNNPGITYVDAQEFLYVMQGGLRYYSVSVDGDQMTLEFKTPMGSYLNFYTYDMDIDATENTVYFSDINFSSDFNISPNISYSSDMTVTDSDYQEGDYETTIDLDNYDIDIIEEDGALFMPLYLANLLFTGDSVNTYESGDKLYVVSDFQEATDIFNHQEITDPAEEQNLITNTVNYTALFFDYFYGLKEFFGVESYKDVFLAEGFYDAESIAEFDEMLQTYIYSLNDLHTGVVDYGDNATLVQTPRAPEDSRLYKVYSVYQSDACNYRDYEFKFTEYPAYYVLELNEFTLDTATYLKDNLVDLNPDKPIYIDLGCNSGGVLLAVFEMMSYLTDNQFAFKYKNPASGEVFTYYYQSKTERALPNTFYLFTSPMTYSAANLLTSLIKDNDLATIVGYPTSGGACSVIYTVLPNNLVLTHSSLMAILNQNGDIIEDGIQPDYQLEQGYSMTDTLDYVYQYYENNILDTITDQSTSTQVNLDLTTKSLPDDIYFDHYTIEITDPETGDVYSSEEVDNINFNYTKTMDVVNGTYSVHVYVSYEYKGILATGDLYTNIINTP